MYLVTAATQFEMEPFQIACQQEGIHCLVTGVGPVETAVRLMSTLHKLPEQIKGIVNFGVGGAYINQDGSAKAGILDICLAEKEVFGDLGICLEGKIERITGKGLEIPDIFDMDPSMLKAAKKALHRAEMTFQSGIFVTVSCTTGTTARGDILAKQYQGLCENMEGAAIARVCQEHNLSCLEIRSISNLVEDRDTRHWKLKEACKRSAQAAAIVVQYLQENGHD